MDRLTAFWYHNDLQCWDQAVLVAGSQDIDWQVLYSWARDEDQDPEIIDRLRTHSGR